MTPDTVGGYPVFDELEEVEEEDTLQASGSFDSPQQLSLKLIQCEVVNTPNNNKLKIQVKQNGGQTSKFAISKPRSSFVRKRIVLRDGNGPRDEAAGCL